MSAKERILELLRANLGKPVPHGVIVRAAGTVEWARRIRDLRAEGWQIEYVQDPKGYRLASLEREQVADTAVISQKLRYTVLNRDQWCRRCGRGPGDGIKLVVDHKLPRAWGGATELSNLWALCEDCNRGKKHFESDFDAEAMKRVLQQPSGKARILEYLKLRVGEPVTKEELEVVAGIHDHPRRIRELRHEGWDIVSFYEDPSLSPGDYILRSATRRSQSPPR
jgi:5-methylcytosine-specific restriction endonuclease McrA